MQEATDNTSGEQPAPQASQRASGRRPTGEVCCGFNDGEQETLSKGVTSRRARAARAIVGAGYLAVAGALATRRTPGRVALWPAALVPAWFGVSHLVAALIGYRGCPELGAIPSVLQGRTIKTECRSWELADRWLERD